MCDAELRVELLPDGTVLIASHEIHSNDPFHLCGEVNDVRELYANAQNVPEPPAESTAVGDGDGDGILVRDYCSDDHTLIRAGSRVRITQQTPSLLFCVGVEGKQETGIWCLRRDVILCPPGWVSWVLPCERVCHAALPFRAQVVRAYCIGPRGARAPCCSKIDGRDVVLKTHKKCDFLVLLALTADAHEEEKNAEGTGLHRRRRATARHHVSLAWGSVCVALDQDVALLHARLVACHNEPSSCLPHVFLVLAETRDGTSATITLSGDSCIDVACGTASNTRVSRITALWKDPVDFPEAPAEADLELEWSAFV